MCKAVLSTMRISAGTSGFSVGDFIAVASLIFSVLSSLVSSRYDELRATENWNTNVRA
jgi:hypothetical protein